MRSEGLVSLDSPPSVARTLTAVRIESVPVAADSRSSLPPEADEVGRPEGESASKILLSCGDVDELGDPSSFTIFLVLFGGLESIAATREVASPSAVVAVASERKYSSIRWYGAVSLMTSILLCRILSAPSDTFGRG